MKRKSIISAVTAAAMCLGMAAAIPSVSSAEDSAYKIFCVGDSITDGYINGDNGYRKYLCYYLQQEGISYDMVGPKNSWSDSATYNWNGTTITYDPAHCGYSGYSTMSYNTGYNRTGIYETLFGNGNLMETYDPDMILLQIGTNDLLDANLEIRSGATDITGTTTAIDRLETVVDKILENMDSTDVLFVSTVPDIDAYTRYDWLNAYGYLYGIDTYNDRDGLMAKVQECVDAYNAGVQALVAEKQAEGKNVQLSDIHSCIDYTAGDLEDGCHPSEQGYAKMGAHWAEKIVSYLNGGETTIVPPTTDPTTEATTEATTTEEPTEPTTEATTTEEPTEPTTEATTTEEPTEPTTEATTTEEPTEPTTEATTTEEPTEPTTEATTTEEPTEPTTEPATEDTSNDTMPVRGDVDENGDVSMTDIVKLQKYLLGLDTLNTKAFDCADMDENSQVNAYDLTRLKRYVLSITPMPL